MDPNAHISMRAHDKLSGKLDKRNLSSVVVNNNTYKGDPQIHTKVRDQFY